MINEQVAQKLETQFPGAVIVQEEPVEDCIMLTSDQWQDVAKFLRDDPELKFDSLQCITGVDLGDENPMDVRYNLHSMSLLHKIEIRIPVKKDNPTIPSIEKIWRIGDWFEREVYDMYGIRFEGHRDLRRMLLPEDWEGWPLRKDYETPQTYHGMVVPKVKS
ncbi:MAG: NADH-quinone oxidoreductase subunit C [Candidatus Marinimicrobia bacterium]|nr:NADH-quinone oxidoreductase subunit C [Candidatus Neomarinimicrobiota bacterium]MBL7060031.1 NADH-quinone oxidoreductase subunit C [Candidatus Neomarinimicrobiota bacterium]